MIELLHTPTWLLAGNTLLPDGPEAEAHLTRRLGQVPDRTEAKKGTIAHRILAAHNTDNSSDLLRLRFDSLASHDITYVGVIQTARASGMTRFPVPYVLTNCHNSLCAVGGTINEDDHRFALSAARKYGGIFVPPHLAVIHSYNREMMSGCGRMILASDSHTRYGALGTMGVGEGGGEIAKQLCSRTYDLACPDVIAVHLSGSPQPGVGPHDVALAIIGAVYEKGFVKNKVMEFVGDGIANLPMDFRNGIDVMTTEAGCLSSIWITDDRTREYFEIHGRPEAYHTLAPEPVTLYDGAVRVDLSCIRPMIALPFHPSNVYPIEELNRNAFDILRAVEETCRNQLGRPDLPLRLTDKIGSNGRLRVDQGVIAGCAGGTFDNLMAAAAYLQNHSTGNGDFALSVYPDSQPTHLALTRNGAAATLMEAGAILRSAFCGPCFGAGDTPANGGLSIRHTTRNFPHREGSKPGEGQLSLVALMDARSIAATAAAGGRLTPATECPEAEPRAIYHFDLNLYRRRVYDGFCHPVPDAELAFGPNIRDWPEIPALPENLLIRVVSQITDPVTTTDELIPSGETSAYRSNPLRLAEFTLSRKDPNYVAAAKQVQQLERARKDGEMTSELEELLVRLRTLPELETLSPADLGIGSAVNALRPGDGSAREQAASCQRVLGGCANLALEYATKRYRSNLLNWGMLPLLTTTPERFGKDVWLFLPGVRAALKSGTNTLSGYLLAESIQPVSFDLGPLTDEEREILLAGCLINHYRTA